jgi:hypothetical protein
MGRDARCGRRCAASQCIAINDDDTVVALTMGRIAAYYYLQYTTAALFSSNLQADMDLEQLTGVLCAAAEYDELPVRHNEDKLNAELANQVGWFSNPSHFELPTRRSAHYCESRLWPSPPQGARH